MFSDKYHNETRKELIQEFYKTIWTDIRNLQQIVFQNILVLAWVGFLIKFALKYDDGKYFYLAIIVSQIIISWLIFIILELAYNYRRAQIISTNIEKIFKFYQVNNRKIIPEEWHKCKTDLPEIHKIHLYFLIVIFFSLTFLGLIFKDFSIRSILDFLSYILIIGLCMIGIVGFLCYWKCLRKKRLEELKKEFEIDK